MIHRRRAGILTFDVKRRKLFTLCLPLMMTLSQPLEAGLKPHSLGEDHTADVTLVAAPQELQFGTARVAGMTYNGSYAGPLLKVKPGGTLHVRLVNHLQEDTNLHFHGILTSPLGRSDNMMIAVKPGDSFDYEIKVPRLQSPGLYWYHTHIHGSTEEGVMGGLSGPLLVEGFADRFVSGSRPVEQILVLKEYRDRRGDDGDHRDQFDGRIMTINGQAEAALNMQPGERQLWHVGNFGPNLPFRLSIQGHSFTIVGRDGVPALHPTVVDALTVNPGSRYEVFIDAGAPGTFPILGSDDDGDERGRGWRRRHDDRSENEQVGVLQVSGTAAPATIVPQLQPAPARDLAGAHIDAFRTIVFAGNRREYTINGNVFDHTRVDTRVPLGNIEQWTIENDSRELHVFHIHQVNFQVMEIEGQAQSFNGAVDTVPVLPHQSVVVRLAFTDPEIVGRFMYHCHVLEHEDRGMMAQIEVYDPRHPTGSNDREATGMPSMR